MKHSLKDTSLVPPINELKWKLQSLATLDSIMAADWALRYFSFNSKWGPTEMMASMRDGEGGEFFFLFNPAGAAGKIYCKKTALGAHAASALAAVPADFSSFVQEPAFSLDVATCYLWQRFGDNRWSVTPAGILELPFLAFVSDQGEHYRAWAGGYYQKELSAEAVRAIFGHEALTAKIVKSLNEHADFAGLVIDAEEIGYPH